jgi:hypothetical protein
VPSPDAWASLTPAEQAARGECSSDQCILDDQRFFVIGRLIIPVIGSEEPFAWLTWIEINQDDFCDIQEKWFAEGRKSTPPYIGQLANKLSLYPENTLGLRVSLQSRPLPDRPNIHVIQQHSLKYEQSEGISSSRVQEIAHLFTS